MLGHNNKFAQQLLGAQDLGQWSDTLSEMASQLGFQYYLFGIVPHRATELETAFLVSNYPEQWRAEYDSQHLHGVDPTVEHCLRSAVPIAWEAGTFNSRPQQQFFERARGHGLRSGITLPVHGANGEFGMMSFVSSDDVTMRDQVQALSHMTLMRDYAVESSHKFTASAQQAPAAQVTLTEREMECLKWVAAGKSSWEVSRILGRSEATINFHVANIMRKFDVQTRQQAVVRAIKAGMIAAA